ncbi:hypothetical protein Cfor_03257 [Coptotermes formosanus]|uniref:aspartate transaminase n=1 Tax=Coptotermes formosanus TaxID=36987 RepID=A0A6L2PXQ4_COPFO|nr:hypothetical protein Cfor_03257 [Coptotermes formosanus]
MATPHFQPLENNQEFLDVIDVCMKDNADKSEQKIDLIPGDITTTKFVVRLKFPAMATLLIGQNSISRGTYRDENGKPWVLPCVLRIENEMLRSATYNHEYVLFLGLDLFKELVPPLVLGENSSALKSGRAFGIQTASGTCALRIGAELLVRHAKYTTFYTSVQTWDQHEATFLYAGFSNSRQYRYWDPVKRGVDFDGMMQDIRQAPENSVIVLQACAHNPTGCDLTKEQWIKVADVVQEKKLYPFFDIAYQGFASGDMEEDAWPVRYFVDRGLETIQVMVKRLQAVRQGLKQRLEKLGTPGNWNHITAQTGMFSFTGLTSKYALWHFRDGNINR